MGNDEISRTEQYYVGFAWDYAIRTVRADMSELHDRFLSKLPAGGRILDVGCGSGRDLRVFVERGYKAVGLDASGPLIDFATTYSGAPCVVGRIEDITEVGAFDGIWACASLLHFRKPAIDSVLRKLRKALVPGGVLFASVQEGKGECTIPDGRFFAYFQKPEFISALSSAGFSIADSWITEDMLCRVAASNWINVLATA